MKRGAKPQKRIAIQWTPDFAYALGLLTTDGNLSKDGRHLNFTSKEKELVKLFSTCLNLQNKIGRKISGFTGKKIYFQIQFGDVEFYKWCLGIGLKPNKSKTLTKLKVPDKYFFDFLRGCFDGDGSIYAYWDPRWHSSYMFYLAFASGSLDFLKWLQDTTGRLIKIPGKIQLSGRVWQLRFAKKDTLAIINKMYRSKNIPYLKRKFTKAKKIFEIEKNHNKCAGGGTR